MALTAKQAQCLAYGLPALAVAIALGAVFRPALMQAQQQTGNTERSRQLNAIAKDIISKRCYGMDRAPIKGESIDVPSSALHSSCVKGANWYGFLAVLNNQTRVIEVFTDTELKAVLSNLKTGK
jgi:hypothetical protein